MNSVSSAWCASFCGAGELCPAGVSRGPGGPARGGGDAAQCRGEGLESPGLALLPTVSVAVGRSLTWSGPQCSLLYSERDRLGSPRCL